jgi:hypothetical protein
MIKKLLVSIIVVLFATVVTGQQVTLTTTSSSTWSPERVDKNGDLLKWTASNSEIGTLIIDANDPVFDFSANNGTPINITVTSTDNLAGLTRLYFWSLELTDLDVTGASDIERLESRDNQLTSLDVTQNLELNRLDLRFNNLSSIDVSQNTKLTRLDLRENVLISSIDVTNNPVLNWLRVSSLQINSLDLTQNPLLEYLRTENTQLNSINISNNNLLNFVKSNSAQLTTVDLDKLVNDLDVSGVTNGNLEIRNNPQGLTQTAQPSYDNLVSKGWTIDVIAPPVPSVETIVLTTTSKSNAWSPFAIVNSGATLKWEVTGGVTIAEVEIDDPTFDLSGNTGTATITIKSDFGFYGLTRLHFWNDNGVGSEITTIDVSNADELERLDMRFNQLPSIDVTQNINLNRLNLRGTGQLTSGSIDLSQNTLLTRFEADASSLATLDITNNPLLTDVRVDAAQLPTAELDALVNALDSYGLSNGNLEIKNNPGSLTSAAQPAYDNLVGKGWTIDVDAPTVPSVETIVLTTTSKSNAWSPFAVTNSGATLKWEVTGGVTIAEVETDDPTFDLSGNTGTATITITSDFGFSGLTYLNFWNDNGVGSEITSIDVTNAEELERLDMRFNQLVSLDISQNVVLNRLNVRGAGNLISGVLDISNNPLLTRIEADATALSSIDVTNNPLLTNVRVFAAQLPTTDLDQIVNSLDGFGLSNGNLEIRNNPGSLSSAAQPAFDNLVGKGWTIDVDAPLAPGAQINLTGNGIDIVNSAPAIIENGTDFGQTTLSNPVTE